MSENAKVLNAPEDILRGPGFMKFTDRLIRILKDRGIIARSCNYFVCKHPVEEVTEGGLILSKGDVELEARKTGYGRVVAIPNNNKDDSNYNDIQPGMFVMYNHGGHYPLPIQAVRLMLGIKDFPENFIYAVPDNEIIATVDNSDTGKRV